MPVRDRPRSYPLATTWSSPTLTRTTSNGTWVEGDYQVWQNVDPVWKIHAGDYERSGRHLSNLPLVNGKLTFKSRFPPNLVDTQVITSTGFGWLLSSASWLTAAESNRALLLNNAIVGAKEEQVNVAMFIGELNKTADLLSDTASRIAKAASDVKSGRFSSAARKLKIQKPKGARRSRSYANNWLEYSYGWTPLVVDMVGAMQHLHRGARELYIKSRSRVTTVRPPYAWNGQVLIEQQTASQHRLKVQWQATASRTVMEQVRLVFRLNEAFWDQVSRLGFMDPGTLVLESIPLSFVAEWFVNIGDVLRDINTGLTLEYVTCSYTEYHQHTGQLIGIPTWTDLKATQFIYQAIDAHVEPTSWEEYRVRRRVVPEPEVQVTWALKCPLSVNHAITSVALAAQRLPK